MTPMALEHRLTARLKLRQLKLLVSVGEHQNIMRAAQVLNIAQPAATKIIHDFEAVLGVPLFERSSRGVTTTVFGDVVIEHARKILAQLSHASEEIVSLQEGTSGRITVGAHQVAATTLLPRAILRLGQDRPNVSIRVVEGTIDVLLTQLEIGDLDLVVGRLPERWERDRLTHEVLYYEPLSLVARRDHPLARRAALSLSDLTQESWVLPLKNTWLWRHIEEEFHKDNLEPPGRGVESMSVLANHTLLLESDMIGVMPYNVVETQEGLVRLPYRFRSEPGPLGVSYRNSEGLTPAARLFVKTLKDVGAELVKTPGSQRSTDAAALHAETASLNRLCNRN